MSEQKFIETIRRMIDFHKYYGMTTHIEDMSDQQLRAIYRIQETYREIPKRKAT